MKSLSFILSSIVLLKDSSYPVTKTDYLCTCKEEFEVFWMNLYVNEQVMIVFISMMSQETEELSLTSDCLLKKSIVTKCTDTLYIESRFRGACVHPSNISVIQTETRMDCIPAYIGNFQTIYERLDTTMQYTSLYKTYCEHIYFCGSIVKWFS